VIPVAWVGGDPLDLSDVDVRERVVRTGPGGLALPKADTGEGRQLRRWLVQLMAAERLVTAEARARGLDAGGAPGLDEIGVGAALLELGSVAAALLSQNALARAVFAAVTADVAVPLERVARYHADNPELFGVEERRLVRHAITAGPDADPNLDGRPVRTLRRGELVGAVERAAFAAAPGDVIGPIHDPLGWHTLRLEAIQPGRTRSLDEVRGEIGAVLRSHARRRAFTAWLDGRTAELVRLAPGYEHPGDPSQPDNVHRH
jgi:[acyl-carrier-protein] S-malonyltransferase